MECTFYSVTPYVFDFRPGYRKNDGNNINNNNDPSGNKISPSNCLTLKTSGEHGHDLFAAKYVHF